MLVQQGLARAQGIISTMPDGMSVVEARGIPMILPETGDASGPGPAFRQFTSIGDEIAYATKCIKAWHERGDFLGDIAVICMKPDHGKRIAHQLHALGIPHLLMSGFPTGDLHPIYITPMPGTHKTVENGITPTERDHARIMDVRGGELRRT